jgi:hypothetical protein
VRLERGLVEAILRSHLRCVDVDLRERRLGDSYLVHVVYDTYDPDPARFGASVCGHPEVQMGDVSLIPLVELGKRCVHHRRDRIAGRVLLVEVPSSHHPEPQNLL